MNARRGLGRRGNGHDESLGTGERNEAETRAGAVRTVNRPQITGAPEVGPKQECMGLAAEPMGMGAAPYPTAGPGQRLRLQGSKKFRQKPWSYGGDAEEFGSVLLHQMAFWSFHFQMIHPPVVGTNTLKEEADLGVLHHVCLCARQPFGQG